MSHEKSQPATDPDQGVLWQRARLLKRHSFHDSVGSLPFTVEAGALVWVRAKPPHLRGPYPVYSLWTPPWDGEPVPLCITARSIELLPEFTRDPAQESDGGPQAPPVA